MNNTLKEKNRIKRKKCPACNSTKYELVDKSMRCSRCAFVNKPMKAIEENLNKD